jgi:hypothetical protein
MRRALSVVAVGIIVVAFGACGGGGGGGDQDAFCDELSALSDQVADGDLATNEGLDDAVDRVNDLFESASDGDEKDAVEKVGNALEDADADEAADTAETIQDELGDIADDQCNIDSDEFAIAPDETTTTTEQETTTTTEGDDGTTTTDGGDAGGATEVNARQDVPADFEADEDRTAADACFNGDASSCDSLFFSTNVGTVAEAYGASCGGRLADEDKVEGTCSELITAPDEPPAGITDTANAQACFGGDMNACDDLFRGAADDSPDKRYGALCGERIPNTSAFCVDIFGDQAFQ